MFLQFQFLFRPTHLASLHKVSRPTGSLVAFNKQCTHTTVTNHIIDNQGAQAP